jgi:hypothetical protein
MGGVGALIAATAAALATSAQADTFRFGNSDSYITLSPSHSYGSAGSSPDLVNRPVVRGGQS